MGFNSSPKFKVKSHNIIVAIFTNKTVLASIALTLLFIIIFHIGSTVSVPGIVITGGALNTNTFASMLNLLAGGGLSRLSVFSVGVGPYITSQIIVQLLSSDLIPPLSRMAKSGERGKKKLEIITRILTLPFCVAQSYAVVALILQNSNGSITIFGATTLGDLSVGSIVALISIFTAGSYISLFIGDMITKRGVGNGITLLILSGIVASVFSNFSIAYDTIAGKFDQTKLTETITMIISVILYFALFVVLMLAVVFIDQSIRKIPIQQTGQGLITEVEKLPFLPLKINVAGVIPVIFASSLMTIPETIGQFLSSSNEFGWFINEYLLISTPVGLSLYALFIILFSFFYSYIQINPQQMSENFEKSGRFIPGVKSGHDTELHITKILNRINWIGAPFLALIAALPYLISYITSIPSGIALGGTGIIIMVSGSMELWYSIRSNTVTSGYNVHRTKIENKINEKVNNNVDDSTDHQLW